MLTGQAPVEYIDDIRRAFSTILKVHVAKVRPKAMLRLPGYRRARAKVHELGEGLMRDYRAPSGEQAPTLVDDLMAAHAKDPELLNRADMLMALTGPYIAGLDTVANTLGSLVYAVLKHPQVLERVRAEADAVFAREHLDDDALEQLPSVNGAVQETLRLYPVAVSQIRVAVQDFEYGGHLVRAGETVHCAVSAPHFLAEFYPDPMRFDIDRYSAERREHAKPGAYSPFGRGPHTCLGKGIADVQMTLTAARLFHRFDLALPSPDYVLRRKAAPAPGPVAGFAVTVVGRRQG
jgi:cytochrome P450